MEKFIKITTPTYTCERCNMNKNRQKFISLHSILNDFGGINDESDFTSFCHDCIGEILTENGKEKARQYYKEESKNRVENIHNGYCKSLLRTNSRNTLSSDDIPIELVELKRNTLLLKRKIKNHA